MIYDYVVSDKVGVDVINMRDVYKNNDIAYEYDSSDNKHNDDVI